MTSRRFEDMRKAYQNEKRREGSRRAQWNNFITTTGPRYVVVNWITGGKRGIALCVELETDRLDLALSRRKVVAASHLPKDRSTSVLIYDRAVNAKLHLVGGVPFRR